MIVVFGTRFYGKISTVENQWIETKFFHFMFVPIFPVESLFVTDTHWRGRDGLNIATNSKSIIATYMRLLTGVFACFMIGLAYALSDNFNNDGIYECWTIGLLSAAAWVYFCFYFGKATEADKQMRTKVGKLTGYYALPHWLDFSYQLSLLKHYEQLYSQRYPEADWKNDLHNGTTDAKKIKLLYAIALFNCMAYDSPENDKLYAMADELLKNHPQGAIAVLQE